MAASTISVLQISPIPAPEDIEPLFTEDILERALDIIENRYVGQVFKKNVIFEVRRTLREIFLRQADKRNLNPHGLGELIDKLILEVRVDHGSIHVVINSDLIDEVDRYLYNRKCQVCGMKVPGGHHHDQMECNTYLVEDMMSV